MQSSIFLINVIKTKPFTEQFELLTNMQHFNLLLQNNFVTCIVKTAAGEKLSRDHIQHSETQKKEEQKVVICKKGLPNLKENTFITKACKNRFF